MNRLKRLIKNKLNTLGFKTKRHIIVFESDDWGGIRIPSKKIIDEFKSKFPNLSLDNYQSFDCLENEDDIKNLQNVLTSVKDKNNNNAQFTLNFVTSNPDFKKISDNNFSKYYGEKITDTYINQYGNTNILKNINDGIKNKCFSVELHTREHLNSTQWLKNINKNDYCKFAFNNKMIGVDQKKYSNMDTFNISNTNEDFEEIISTAKQNFFELFGQYPKSFIASCYVWDKSLEKILFNNEIKYIQGKVLKNTPLKNGKLKKTLMIMGKKNKLGQVYTTRNVIFEPSVDYKKNVSPEQCAQKTFNDICFLFKHKKPAVICSHRVNYVSNIDENNAKFGIESLKLLLKKLTSTFDDIEFMSSSDFTKLTQEKK